MKARRILTITGIALISIAIVLLLLNNKKKLDDAKKPVDRSNIAVKVTADTAVFKVVDGTLTQPATIIAENEATLSAEISGKIKGLNIDLGSYVKRGQVVGHIDAAETEQKLEVAELAITKLERDYERNKVLVAGNATNANAISDSKYELDAKRLEAEQLRTQISKSKIIAPANGIVTDRQKIAGEYVSTGTVIASIVDVESLKANVSVPENDVSYIRKGQKAIVTSDAYPDDNFSGIVNYISPKGDENHNYIVQLTITGNSTSNLKAGLYVNVQFAQKEVKRSVLMIPKRALAEGVKNPFIFVYKNGTAEERKLVTGSESGDYIEIRSGLSAGEVVVTSGQINLINGSKIQIIKAR